MYRQLFSSRLRPGLLALLTALLALTGLGTVPSATARPYINVSAGGPYNGVVGQPVLFHASVSGPTPSIALKYVWSFGDGGTAAQASPTHIYRHAGTFIASVAVSAGSDTGQDTATVTIRPAQQPQPSFTVNASAPSTGTVGQPLQFTATPVGTGDLSRLAYTWDFGDGTSGAGKNTTHAYSAPSTYIASVIATDGVQVASDTVTVSVTPAPANFAVSAGGPYSGFTQQPIQFIAQIVGTGNLSNVAYAWTFGDGGTAVGRNPQHTYATPGVYNVSLTASNGSLTSQDTTIADVIAPPQNALNVSAGGPYTATAGQPVTMTATLSGPVPLIVLEYDWEFGDGTIGIGQTVTHAYQAQGTYIATVTVGPPGGGGPTGAATTSVTVGPGAPTGPSVTYAPGWNIVGGPTGATFPQANGPLYTFPAGATAYQSIPNTQPITGGNGYWAYFTAATIVSFTADPTAPVTISAPANQYIMVGNPSVTRQATVTGADVVYVYDPVAGAYSNSTTLPPGVGAWALRSTAGSVTVTPSTTATTP
jgi:PKD repeat protein